MRKISVFLFLFLSLSAQAQNFTSRSEFLRLIRNESRMFSDTFVVNDYNLMRLLNESVAETDNKLRPNQGFDSIWTTGQVSTYSLNNDCYDNAVLSVRVLSDSTTGKYELSKRVELNEQGTFELSTSGAPIWYSTHGRTITFVPAPAQEMRVELFYEARSREFSLAAADSGDTIITIDPEHDQLIVDYAAYLLYKRMGVFDKAQTLLEIWKVGVAEARQLMGRPPDPLINRIEKGQ